MFWNQGKRWNSCLLLIAFFPAAVCLPIQTAVNKRGEIAPRPRRANFLG
jgi:hypothetical protein